jgi:hypothetical protein
MQMGKQLLFLTIFAFAAATAAHAQGKKQSARGKPTRSECTQKVSAMPGMMNQGRLMRGAGPAISRCMRGEPI